MVIVRRFITFTTFFLIICNYRLVPTLTNYFVLPYINTDITYFYGTMRWHFTGIWIKKIKKKIKQGDRRPNYAPVAYPAPSLSSEYDYFYFFSHCHTIVRSSLSYLLLFRYIRTGLQRHRLMQHLLQGVSCSVVPTNSSLFTISSTLFRWSKVRL